MIDSGTILPDDGSREPGLGFLERAARPEFGFKADGVGAGMGEDRISHARPLTRKP